jgi:group I intron endonuclease
MLGTPNALNTYRGKNFKDNTMDNQQETNKNRILRDCTWSVEIILRRISPILSNLAVLGDRSIFAFCFNDGFLTIIRCLVFFILSLGLMSLNLNLDLLDTFNFFFASLHGFNDFNHGIYLLYFFPAIKLYSKEGSDSKNLPLSVFQHAVKIYNDPKNQRSLIREDNMDKVGIYAWVNMENGNYYIGSGNPLYLRISDYYQNWYLLSHSNLYIVRAALSLSLLERERAASPLLRRGDAFNKYGMNNFTLVILEYANPESLISCEQKWIDLLNPEYNVNPTAGNSKGYKHTVESMEKMRTAALGREHSEQVKQAMSESRMGDKNPFYGKTHSEENKAALFF